jgi:large subunit ribosomal protein L4
MPKNMRRAAIRSALTALLNDGQLVFVEPITMDAPKTKDIKRIINAVTGGGTALLLIGERSANNDNVQRSTWNLPDAKPLLADYLNIRDLLQYDKVIVPMDALDVIVRIWGKADKADKGE